MKRIICLILALLLLCPAAFAAGDMKLQFSNPKGEVGETVKITVSVKDAPVACSYKIVLTYDDTLIKPEAIDKINSKGYFMKNLETEHNGKPAVNALSVDATNAFEGDCDLFYATFKILKAPADGKITLDVAYTEFYDYDIKPMTAEIGPCVITVPTKDSTPEDQPSSGGEDEKEPEKEPEDTQKPGEDQPTQKPKDPETPDSGNSSEPDTKPEVTPDAPQEEPEEDAVTGEWFVDKDLDEIAHAKDDGTIDEYKGTFIYDEEDKVTKVELTDEEGNPAGELIVEENEAGVLTVIAQKLLKDQASTLPWLWITLGVVVVGGGIAAAVIIILKKRKKEEE